MGEVRVRGGRERLRALDALGGDPDLLGSLRNSREPPSGGRTSDAFLEETQPSFLPNTGDHIMYHPNQNTSEIQRRSS